MALRAVRRTEGEAAPERGAGRAVVTHVDDVQRQSGAAPTKKGNIELGTECDFHCRPIVPSEQEVERVASWVSLLHSGDFFCLVAFL